MTADRHDFHFGAIKDARVCESTLMWKEKAGGEVLFRRKGVDQSFHSLSDLGLNEQQELQLVNHLLAHYRPHAVPDGNGYHAASAAVALDEQDGKKSRRLFIAVNNEKAIADPFEGRGCAETAIIRETQETLAREDVEFDRLYLMSGVAKKSPLKELTDVQPGHVSCCCGECRANLRKHMSKGTFIMIPSNKGEDDLTINKTAEAASELSSKEAWEIPYDKMYPMPSHFEMKKELFPIVEEGYKYITNDEIPPLPIEHKIPAITDLGALAEKGLEWLKDFMKLRGAYENQGFSPQALNENPTPENVNRTMLQLVKNAYHVHAGAIKAGGPDGKDRPIEIRAIMVKTTKGEFYPGVVVNGDLWLPSKPKGSVVALSNTLNQKGISDIYVMNFNNKGIEGEKQGDQEHDLRMLNPAALGRLIKNCNSSDNPTVHLMPVNSGKLSAEELQKCEVDTKLRDAFGPDFANPKKTNEIAM